MDDMTQVICLHRLNVQENFPIVFHSSVRRATNWLQSSVGNPE